MKIKNKIRLRLYPIKISNTSNFQLYFDFNYD